MVATLDRPKRTKGTPTPEGDFVVFENVPLFDVHTGDDGVEYDERLLQAIAANCNRRIVRTGDWCPIVVAHTRDKGEKASAVDDPPVIGLAGPFYVADFMNSDGQKSRAIHATFWIFPDQEQTFLRNPRRSVEIWPEEQPEQRYFDPISVLGAETPKRDLGMIYSRRAGSTSRPTHHYLNGPLRYSKRYTAPLKYQEAVSTAGPNTSFIPGGVDLKKKRNAKGAAMALSPDDLSQIIQALEPVIQQKVDAATVAGPDAGGLPPMDAPGGEPGLDAPGGAAPLGAPPASPPGLDAPGGAPGMDAPGGAPPLGGPPRDMDEDAQLYARGLGRKFMKYNKDGDWDDTGSDSFMDSLDDDDKDHLEKYFKYMCDDEGAKKKYSERYAKSSIGGEDLTEKPGDSSPSGSMNADEMSGGKPEKYSKGKPMESMQYAKVKKERDEAVQRYAKLDRDHKELVQKYAKLEKENGDLQVKERYSKRMVKLKELETEYAFDAEEEMVLTEDLNDNQFERHTTQIIPQRYMKVSGGMLPTGEERKLDRAPDEKPQRYAKIVTDFVLKYRKEGRMVDYDKVMKMAIENDGKIDESKVFQGNGHAA